MQSLDEQGFCFRHSVSDEEGVRGCYDHGAFLFQGLQEFLARPRRGNFSQSFGRAPLYFWLGMVDVLQKIGFYSQRRLSFPPVGVQAVQHPYHSPRPYPSFSDDRDESICHRRIAD